VYPPPFHIPGRFHPGYSMLGRWLRRRTGDARQAEAYLIVVAAAFGLVLLLAPALAASFLEAGTQAGRAGGLRPDVVFWLAELGALLLAGLVGGLGFEPAVTVTCAADHLLLRQGTSTCRIPYDALRSVEPLPRLLFHRHYRRYAATRVFATRLPDPLLLLQTPEGPVVVGLAAPDAAALAAFLGERTNAASRHAPVGA
jgi:hypothetical protein